MINLYLAELDRALGHHLPEDIREARLREAKGHLLMAAQELGEEEAVLRYGSARLVANEMVRVYRGYETASVWKLTCRLGLLWPIKSFLTALAQLAYLSVTPSLSTGHDRIALTVLNVLSWSSTIALQVLFVRLAFQSRRWIAAPICFWYLLGLVIHSACFILGSGKSFPSDLKIFLPEFLVIVIELLILNTIAILAALYSDRRLRRAR